LALVKTYRVFLILNCKIIFVLFKNSSHFLQRPESIVR